MPTWTFVRHGQSAANRDRRFAGHLDAPLTELGCAQARAARAVLPRIPFCHVLASDLTRARKTATILLAGRNVPVVERPPLRERHCGCYEGRSYAEAEADGAMEGIFHAFGGRPDGGESLADVALRALTELVSWVDQGDLLIVCHGALIRAVVGFLDGVDEDRIGLYRPRNLEFITRNVHPRAVHRAVDRLAAQIPQPPFPGGLPRVAPYAPHREGAARRDEAASFSRGNPSAFGRQRRV